MADGAIASAEGRLRQVALARRSSQLSWPSSSLLALPARNLAFKLLATPCSQRRDVMQTV